MDIFVSKLWPTHIPLVSLCYIMGGRIPQYEKDIISTLGLGKRTIRTGTNTTQRKIQIRGREFLKEHRTNIQ
ncbi:hypothetical protein XELAEV_18003322mg [Xenopus laevis]|uniref:Uncharacterized protein n=1 Tax=Xenopus laevis TaxID=8355 RepID=A0A974BPG2_XENLA|nr:hypothetical protein XELAEV_18003322mg [Xenopus laevis]